MGFSREKAGTSPKVADSNGLEKAPPSPEIESIVNFGEQIGSPGLQHGMIPVDVAAEKTLLKKLDKRLIPLLFTICECSRAW